MKISTAGFGAYDVRGVYPETINETIAYRIGRTFPKLFGAKRVVVGYDIRLSGHGLCEALVRGLTAAGCHVLDIGMCGTEMIYFATGYYALDGGIMITASHNPKEYNGMKFVQRGAVPISSKNGLLELKKAVEQFNENNVLTADGEGNCACPGVEQRNILADYVEYILSRVNVSEIRPMKVVANVGNGAAGQVVQALARKLPIELVMVNAEPDGHFPHGVPNPLLPENREATARVVREQEADLGVAWDGDFDRCFLFDERGTCIDGYYLVGFLAEAFLRREPGARIVHDSRLTWNTIEMVRTHGGVPVICRSGHAFIKAKMREVDAIYGGEMSSHHYFRDFYYCDSGMIPWLLVMELFSRSGSKKFSSLMVEHMAHYPISGEINIRVQDAEAVFARVEARYGSQGAISHLDGLSVEFPRWRFNLRQSATEPVVRLNVEAKGDQVLCHEKTEELLSFIRL